MPPELLAAIEAIESLPGIGKRSAMRIAFDLVKRGPLRVANFTAALKTLAEGVTTCSECGAFLSNTAGSACSFCTSPKRTHETLCVVENASDIYAVENTGEHNGLYHVLGGVLSPLDGIGPSELNIPKLFSRAKSLGTKEVIVATNPSVEGNATGHYIADALKPLGVRVTRIATGLALGQLLDYAETQAISQSLRQRVDL
ncbi:MAG: Recombination protein RecR [Turneriella sp.]|nr:Recombination protein RecR [Turneriella sp.]